MKLLDRAIEYNWIYSDNAEDNEKKYGQLFTSKETAVFMASLFDITEENRTISILDPGAGSEILFIAFLERIDTLSERIVNLVCYENDEKIIPILKDYLEYAKNNVSFQLIYEIRNENYILDNEIDYNCMIGAATVTYKYDIIIFNTPYKKIPKDAAEAHAMPDICYGAPNLYFLFTEMAFFNLKSN